MDIVDRLRARIKGLEQGLDLPYRKYRSGQFASIKSERDIYKKKFLLALPVKTLQTQYPQTFPNLLEGSFNSPFNHFLVKETPYLMPETGGPAERIRMFRGGESLDWRLVSD